MVYIIPWYIVIQIYILIPIYDIELYLYIHIL